MMKTKTHSASNSPVPPVGRQSVVSDYTAWSKGKDFRVTTVYERDYLAQKDFTAWSKHVTIPAEVIEAEAIWSLDRAQREAELHRSLCLSDRRAA